MRPAVTVLLAVLLATAGCGVRPSGVTTMGKAPTGVAPGVTLYFVDAGGNLAPQLHATRRLGTVPEALALLFDVEPDPDRGMHTEIRNRTVNRVVVTAAPGLIQLAVPLADYEVTGRGIDQIVCTALGVAVQRGESRDTLVRVSFTLASPESDRRRGCPLIRPGR